MSSTTPQWSYITLPNAAPKCHPSHHYKTFWAWNHIYMAFIWRVRCDSSGSALASRLVSLALEEPHLPALPTEQLSEHLQYQVTSNDEFLRWRTIHLELENGFDLGVAVERFRMCPKGKALSWYLNEQLT